MKRALGYIMCAWLLAGTVGAAEDGGTTSPFSFGAGARDLALGGAAVAEAGGHTAVYWNPARLASVQRFQLGGFHTNPYESEVTYQYLGLAVPTMDMGSFSLGVFRLGVDGIEERDAGNLLLGEIEDNRLGFLFGYSRRISGYDFGTAVVMEHHSLGEYSTTSSPGLNLAVQREIARGLSPVSDITLALVVRNLIRPKFKLADQSTDYPLTFTGAVTAGFRPKAEWQQEGSLSLAVTQIDGADVRFAAGLEYSLYDLLHLRGGVRDSRLSFGLGFSYKSFSFDYALVDRDMGSLHTFNLTSSFGSSVSEKRRARKAEREAAFNGLMSDRLTAQNRATVAKLIVEGKNYLQSGRQTDALSNFDRALFLARASGLDTTEAHSLLEQTRVTIEDSNRKRRYREYLDSTEIKFVGGDYLAARYFANLALTEIPNSVQAADMLDRADSALAQTTSREETIHNRLIAVDSLLNYGQVGQALSVALSLEQIAPGDSRVTQALKEADFERLRTEASTAFSSRQFGRTRALLDSALALFPGHRWCLDLKEQTELAEGQLVEKPEIAAPEQPRALSREVRREVEAAYREAQKDFEAGNLASAVETWERVERLFPDYQLVREYLVSAYKYVGVELYSKNELAEAVAVWKKARKLAPENREIRNYIERTETEMRKLQELTYDHE